MYHTGLMKDIIVTLEFSVPRWHKNDVLYFFKKHTPNNITQFEFKEFPGFMTTKYMVKITGNQKQIVNWQNMLYKLIHVSNS